MDYKNIKELKNKHQGQDIWVILAGSSMDYVSSSFFDNKTVMGLNHVYKHYPCDYIMMKDCMEEPRFPRSIEKLNSMNIPLIFSNHFMGHRSKPNNLPKHNNAYMFEHNPRVDNLKTELKKLNDNEIVVSRSSVTSLVHIAAYMGAKNIILCGHDCGTLDENLYYEGYIEEDWISSGNWSGINNWMSRIEAESQTVRTFLMEKYNCNIHSLNPFLNLGLEGHEYKKA